MIFFSSFVQSFLVAFCRLLDQIVQGLRQGRQSQLLSVSPLWDMHRLDHWLVGWLVGSLVSFAGRPMSAMNRWVRALPGWILRSKPTPARGASTWGWSPWMDPHSIPQKGHHGPPPLKVAKTSSWHELSTCLAIHRNFREASAQVDSRAKTGSSGRAW